MQNLIFHEKLTALALVRFLPQSRIVGQTVTYLTKPQMSLRSLRHNRGFRKLPRVSPILVPGSSLGRFSSLSKDIAATVLKWNT